MKFIQAVRPNDEDDSGIGSSIGTAVLSNSLTNTDHNTPPDATSKANAPLSESDPFLIEVASIMEDVESLVGKYVQEMTKTVLQYLGG